MAKPLRSPVLGYNHNVRYHGRVFHVQTEDSGPGNPRLYTHLFYAGTILSSKKHEYDGKEPEDVVKGLMQRLHKAMIKELTHGDHDQRIAAFFMSRGEPPILEGDAAAPPAGGEIQAPPSLDIRAADIRMVAVSGSIDTNAAPKPVQAPVPPPPSVVAPAAMAAAPPAAQVVRPPATPRPAVAVKPQEVKRSPVVLSSSADGVVVQRNVVINVGGGAPPVNGGRVRGTRPRTAVPYVVREGSYGNSALPTRTAPDASTQPLASGRDARLNWDGPAGRASDPGMRPRAPGAPSERTPRPAAPERTPAERAFAPDLVSDKSLDEVILEYLSDDTDNEER